MEENDLFKIKDDDDDDSVSWLIVHRKASKVNQSEHFTRGLLRQNATKKL